MKFNDEFYYLEDMTSSVESAALYGPPPIAIDGCNGFNFSRLFLSKVSVFKELNLSLIFLDSIPEDPPWLPTPYIFYSSE